MQTPQKQLKYKDRMQDRKSTSLNKNYYNKKYNQLQIKINLNTKIVASINC